MPLERVLARPERHREANGIQCRHPSTLDRGFKMRPSRQHSHAPPLHPPRQHRPPPMPRGCEEVGTSSCFEMNHCKK